jgi:hypothetical protein
MTKNMHLAELNVGCLVAPPDDPRVADFMNNLDRINGLGKRMPGFVWMIEGSGRPGTGNTDAKLNGLRSLRISTLSCGGYQLGIRQT